MGKFPLPSQRRSVRRVCLEVTALEDRLVPAVINVNPANYLSLVATAQPGDTVAFAAGNYTQGLNLSGMNGTAGAPIIFDGSAGATILGTASQNTVELDNTSYLVFENFTVDSQHLNDGIKAGGGLNNVAHDILIKNNTIINADSSQQTVGISTKCIAWNWTIQGNTINGAGTGMYLGDSSGFAPFINGTIENNTVENTIGYGIQIKDQEPYALVAGMPSSGSTILRYNEFFNNDIQGALGQGARPNVMIGGFPASGPGAGDTYQIYGNLIDNNVSSGDYLMQVTGRATIHDNILVNDSVGGINVQSHYDDTGTLFSPQQISIYDNTIYGVGTGIAGAASWPVVGNLIFANNSGAPAGNITDSIANAGLYIANPSTAPNAANFTPLPGACQGPAQDLSPFSSDLAYNLDYNGNARPASDTGYGAIEGSGSVTQPPAAPAGLTASAGDGQVTLSWNASSGATTYNVYRWNGSSHALVQNVGGTSFTDTGLNKGTTYWYEVTAVNSAGESGASSEASAMPVAPVPPTPTNLTATPGNARVIVSWASSSGAASYNIYRGSASGGETLLKSGVAGTSLTDTGLTNGKPYYYEISAVNAAGQSALSSEVSATPNARPVVSRLSPNAGPVSGGTRITISGSGFSGATGVFFGGVPATSFTVKSNGSIVAVAPAQSAGTVDVTVLTALGTSVVSSTDQFTYLAKPTVRAVSPTSGPASGGAAVTISGTGLNYVSKVTFGGLAAQFRLNADGTLTAFAPPHLVGLVDILVTSPGGTSAKTTADRFKYF